MAGIFTPNIYPEYSHSENFDLGEGESGENGENGGDGKEETGAKGKIFLGIRIPLTGDAPGCNTLQAVEGEAAA